MLIAIYFILGTALLTYTSVLMWMRDEDDMKSKLRNPHWWLATVVCIVVWPWMLISAIGKAFREVYFEEGL